MGEKDMTQNIGKRIKALRNEKGITQERLIEIVGEDVLSLSTYYDPPDGRIKFNRYLLGSFKEGDDFFNGAIFSSELHELVSESGFLLFQRLELLVEMIVSLSVFFLGDGGGSVVSNALAKGILGDVHLLVCIFHLLFSVRWIKAELLYLSQVCNDGIPVLQELA